MRDYSLASLILSTEMRRRLAVDFVQESLVYSASLFRPRADEGCPIDKEYRVNDQILRPSRDYPRVRDVRVIGEDGQQLGIMDVRRALELAREKSLDLIEVAPQANPPVCRIMDYGRYKYEQSKRDREAHKKQKGGEVKGVFFRPGTDDHDIQFKVRNIVNFLKEGDKVKVTVRFRSRESSHPEFAQKLLEQVEQMVGEHGVVERRPEWEGRTMVMMFAPRKDKRESGAGNRPQEKKGQ